MNAFSISVKNLRGFITKHTTVFFIMLIGLAISTVTIMYITIKTDCGTDYGDIASLSLDKIEMDNSEALLGIEDVSQRLQSYYDDNSSVNYICALIEGDDIFALAFITDEKDNLSRIHSGCKPIDGRFFTDDEISGGENVMITLGLGTEQQSESINGADIKTVGCFAADGRTNAYIPLKTVIDNGIIPTAYNIYYDSDLTVSQTKESKSRLEELFPELEVQTKMDYIKDNAPPNFDFDTLALIVMSAVSILSCAYLYSFMIQMRIKDIYIFKICGASIKNLIGIYTAELLMILLLQFALSLLIFAGCLIPALHKYDIAFVYGMSPKHFVFAFAAIAALALIIYIPVLTFYCRKNAVQIKQSRKG